MVGSCGTELGVEFGLGTQAQRQLFCQEWLCFMELIVGNFPPMNRMYSSE